MKRCIDCKWFWRMGEHRDDGECRYNPPVKICYHEYSTTLSTYHIKEDTKCAEVWVSDYCGKFKAKSNFVSNLLNVFKGR